MTLWQGDKKYSKLQVNEYSDTLYYHKRIKKSIADSAYIVEVTEYKDTSEQLIPVTSGDYAKYSVYKDIHTGNVKLEYFYDAKEDIYNPVISLTLLYSAKTNLRPLSLIRQNLSA